MYDSVLSYIPIRMEAKLGDVVVALAWSSVLGGYSFQHEAAVHSHLHQH